MKIHKKSIFHFLQSICSMSMWDFVPFFRVRNYLYGCFFEKVDSSVPFGAKLYFVCADRKEMAAVNIGKNVSFDRECVIDISAPVTIEDDVWISGRVCILNHIHEVNKKCKKTSQDLIFTDGIEIGEDSWIGYGGLNLAASS